MSKIYVIESGCRYEGGSADSASTNICAAFKRARDIRIEKEAKRIGSHPRQTFKATDRLFWLGDYDYVCIREFEDCEMTTTTNSAPTREQKKNYETCWFCTHRVNEGHNISGTMFHCEFPDIDYKTLDYADGTRKCDKYSADDKSIQFDKTESIDALKARIAELEAEVVRLKTVPMKYRRMQFNAELQDENKELRQKLAASQEENARLKAECDDIKQVQFPRKVEAVAAGWRKQLAAEQLQNERLRSLLAESKPLVQDWVNENGGAGLATFSEIRQTLSEPHDTAALDAYVEQKIKEAGK